LCGGFSVPASDRPNKLLRNTFVLALADGLKWDFSSTPIDIDEIDVLVEKYGGSSLVIVNQITNHGLAQILR